MKMISPRISPRLSIWALVIVLMVAGASCKSKKAAMSATDAAAEKAKMEQEAAMKKQEEAARKQKEMEEKARLEAEAARKKEAEPYNKLQNYFAAISNANSVTSANSSIAEALNLFASNDTPVLIVINESDGQKDYDKPTTIGQYLNYLKDQKKNMNKIGNLQFDQSGKITEVELVKK